MSIFDVFKRRNYYAWYPSYGVSVANHDTAALYRTQPNLRAVVSYLADNAAQIPLKVHDRVGEDDRPRVIDSPAALLLKRPNDDMTAFELKRAIYSDLFLYGRCLCIVIPDNRAESGWQMRHIPATWIQSYEGDWAFSPEAVIISNGQMRMRVPRDKFILFHGYDPTDPVRAADPVEALKDILHEQIESNTFRRQMWRRGGRFNAYITRPKDVQEWTDEAYQRFKDTWRNSWAGADSSDGGGTPILEDGMEIRQVQFNSRDAQWADAKKLGREDVAGVYHINPALIWPGSGQTYASAKDNARALYNEALAPMLMQVTERINHQLLPMVGEDARHYVVYDITIKTEGTFEEKISALMSAAGAPVITRNEARAKLDLPALEGGDVLITPLNVLSGQPNTLSTKPRTKSAPKKYKAAPSDDEKDELTQVYREFFKHQRSVLLPKLGAEKKKGSVKDAEWWNQERWDKELTESLYPVALKQSTEHARRTLAQLGASGYSEERTEAFIYSMAQSRARMVNSKTYDQLMAVNDWDDEDEHGSYSGVFDIAEDDRSESAGAAFACAVAGFAAIDAVKQCLPQSGATKTWVVTSSNPRPEHEAMDGETVSYSEEFSNGGMWPGDSSLDAADVANCQCQVEITIP